MTDWGRGIVVAAALTLAGPARAETGNFDLSGKIYTKYMYRNDNSQGCMTMGNPFWPDDNIVGSNGACSEFELNIKGRVGPKVTAGVRLQSRWGFIWQDWWENGDFKPGVQDTSGESLGMNHAQYIKLRGAFFRMAPPIPTVRWVTVGSTDYSMWNEWTIGKARYIDRDNGSGLFVEGDALAAKKLSYTVGALALPKLWAGPGWQTGLKDNDPNASLYGTDWGFATKLESQTTDDLRLRLIGSWLQDWETDKFSPMLTGDPSADRDADHSVDLATRFRGINGTFDFTYSGLADWISVSGLAAASSNYVNPTYAKNLVEEGDGFSPVLFRIGDHGNPIASNGYAGKLDVELYDPFRNGLSAKFEYFNIGPDFNAVMGARREADVLLTEGIITSGWIRGGQLPTLNIANEFVDFDEPWYETVIGWHGATGILDYVKDTLKLSVEGTAITYNTNRQNRDVAHQYPDFLYTGGFTEVYAYTADVDYANKYARGKDPRSVYADYQDRHTLIGILNGQLALPGFSKAVLNGKVKYVNDYDGRNKARGDDDYRGNMYLGFANLTLQPTNELKASLGYEFTYMTEARRDGTQAQGYIDVNTRRHVARAGLSYAFGGALISYTLEYLHKDLLRASSTYYDMVWNVWRSKATFEVGW